MADEAPESPASTDRRATDPWPQIYGQWRATGLGALTDRLEHELILELLGAVDGRHVLDVGCGDGDLALDLWRRHALVTGIDASTAMIDAARVRARALGADIDLQVARAEALPFANASFDVVAAVTLLCFVPDATGVFRELARVLRPGGRLVIGELGRWSTWAAARRIRAWLGSPLWRDGRFRTAGELRSLAQRAGLEVESIRGAIFYPRSRALARWMAPVDGWLGRRTSFGAAFLALSAAKRG